MPVTVTVSRGNPLPWPIALLLTVVGAVLIVLGFTVVPEVEGMDNTMLDVIAVLLAGPALLVFLVVMVRKGWRDLRENPAEGVPAELPEPPGTDDPDVVGVLVGKGTPPRRAVAGVILALADRHEISIDEYGEQIVIDVAPDAAVHNQGESIVAEALAERADAQRRITGPPFWQGRVPWWRDFVRDARTRARAESLIDSTIPLVGTMVLLIIVGTAFSLIFFWRTPVFVGTILFVNGFPHLLARASGYRLTNAGIRRRAEWVAFARYLHAQRSFRDVGPSGVKVWGPNLVYGAVLGEADKAARPLTPDADDDSPIDEVTTSTKVVKL